MEEKMIDFRDYHKSYTRHSDPKYHSYSYVFNKIIYKRIIFGISKSNRFMRLNGYHLGLLVKTHTMRIVMYVEDGMQDD